MRFCLRRHAFMYVLSNQVTAVDIYLLLLPDGYANGYQNALNCFEFQAGGHDIFMALMFLDRANSSQHRRHFFARDPPPPNSSLRFNKMRCLIPMQCLVSPSHFEIRLSSLSLHYPGSIMRDQLQMVDGTGKLPVTWC